MLLCCIYFGRNIPMGKIADATIKDAWGSKALQDVRYGI
jgi:hypothetical protein